MPRTSLPSALSSAATLICVGCPPLGMDWPLGLQRLIVFEPDPARRQAMTPPAGLSPEMIEALPAPETGQSFLKSYNFPELRAITDPTEVLHGLLPGLQQRGTLATDLVTPGPLLAAWGDLPAPVLLAVWISGLEMQVLRAFDSAGGLDRFDGLHLRPALTPLFETALSAADLIGWTSRRGFVPAYLGTDDPDWLDLSLTGHEQLRAALQALPHLTHVQASQAAAEARAEAAETQAARLPALEQDLSQARASESELAGKVTALQAELTAQSERLQAELAQQRATAESDWRQARETLEAEVARQRAVAEAAKADLSVALRLQDAMSGDLEDLRLRFRQSEETRKQQLALLQQLTPRLQQAATEVRHLMQTAAPERLADPEKASAKAASGRRKGASGGRA